MAVLLTRETRLAIQGVTGRAAAYHIQEMLRIGGKIVGGTSPGHGGETIFGLDVFNSMQDLVASREVDASLIFVPARQAVDAAFEALESGVKLIILIAEGVPVKDAILVIRRAEEYGARIVGPNTPGIYSPGIAKAGLMPVRSFAPGTIGLISRSGTLSYETAWELNCQGLGISTFVGIGGDVVRGTNFVDVLALMEEDPDTHAVVLIGEIGGDHEQVAAEFIKERMHKPVFAFITGRGAKPGRRMGHAGALMAGGVSSFEEKVAVLEANNIPVAGSPNELALMVKKALG